MIFSVEQTIKDSGEKLSEEDKTTLQEAVDEAKKELESDDEARYNAAFETLSQKIQPIVAKLYQQAGGAPEAGGPADGGDEFHQ